MAGREEAAEGGRFNQRRRTRKDLLEAAARLLAKGGVPTLEEIAVAAMVSRATAYRYFPNLEALLLEAAIDQLTLMPDRLFPLDDASTDPVERLEKVDATLQDVFLRNEPALRLTVAQALQQATMGDVPRRQNRRSPLIDAALEPAKAEFTPEARDRLAKALALIIGTEGMIAAKDVLQIDDREAREVKRWAIRALVEAARK